MLGTPCQTIWLWSVIHNTWRELKHSQTSTEHHDLLQWPIPPHHISTSQHSPSTIHHTSWMLYQYSVHFWNKEFLGNQPREILVNTECFGDCLHYQKLMRWTTQPSATFIHPHVLTAERTTKQTNKNDSCVIHYVISWWQRHKQSPNTR